MAKPKVFVTRLIPAKGLDLIREFCDSDVWLDELPPPHEEIIRRVRDVEGLVSLLTDKIDADVMDAAPRLESPQQYGGGRG